MKKILAAIGRDATNIGRMAAYPLRFFTLWLVLTAILWGITGGLWCAWSWQALPLDPAEWGRSGRAVAIIEVFVALFYVQRVGG